MTVPKVSKMHQRVRDVKDGKPVEPLRGVDKELLNNTMWDDARKVHDTALDGAARIGQYVLDVTKNTPADQVINRQELAICVQTFSQDLRNHVDRLNNIYARHSSYEANAKSIEEVKEALQINEEYDTAMQIYDGVISPMVAQIISLLGHTKDAAEFLTEQSRQESEEFIKQKALQEAQNVNVITDLPVREATDKTS